jgi:hypothetical protein
MKINLMVAILAISQLMMLQSILRLYIRVRKLELIEQKLRKLE